MTDYEQNLYEEKVLKILDQLNYEQTSLRADASAGDRFLAFVAKPELPSLESVTGLIVRRFNEFNGPDDEDVAWVEMSSYIANKKGKGACHRWLHRFLTGLTHSERGKVAWSEDWNLHCVLMVLRYVKFTPETVKVGEKIERELSNIDENSKFNWQKAAAKFFATLDDDEFWKLNRPDELFF